MGDRQKGGDDDVVMLLSCFSVPELLLCGGEREGEKLWAEIVEARPKSISRIMSGNFGLTPETGKSRQIVA